MFFTFSDVHLVSVSIAPCVHLFHQHLLSEVCPLAAPQSFSSFALWLSFVTTDCVRVFAYISGRYLGWSLEEFLGGCSIDRPLQAAHFELRSVSQYGGLCCWLASSAAKPWPHSQVLSMFAESIIRRHGRLLNEQLLSCQFSMDVEDDIEHCRVRRG